MKAYTLPDRLKRGTILISKKGAHAEVTTTSKRDDMDEPMYRLKFGKVRSRRLWSRDELQAEGVRILKEKT